MQTTVTIDDQQLKSLMSYTHADTESEAIYKAIQSYLQQAKRQQDLLALRGQADIEDNWQAMRDLEINK
ncbi:type II toxin-antitoxin system VapB family antitoxin [Methylobacter sp.]|uniref:type II toxin-antitoxin system VapB family antitoxin n=1 Tax=Methylobacter sp. TaxID=2051955 RepID=UPI002FDEE4A3